MQIRTVYPTLTRYRRVFIKIRHICKIIFIVLGLASVIVNLAVGGKPWSLVAVWGLIMTWALIFDRTPFEYNWISVIASLLFYVVVLLALIDYCLTSKGWALFVIPIVVFSTLIVSAVLFFIDIRHSMRSSMPVFWLMFFSLMAALVYFLILGDFSWPVIVMGSIAGGLLLICIFFNKAFITELKKRFDTH